MNRKAVKKDKIKNLCDTCRHSSANGEKLKCGIHNTIVVGWFGCCNHQSKKVRGKLFEK